MSKPTYETLVSFNLAPAASTDVERWNTRYGKSVRVVKRTAKGQFSSNVSANQLAKI